MNPSYSFSLLLCIIVLFSSFFSFQNIDLFSLLLVVKFFFCIYWGHLWSVIFNQNSPISYPNQSFFLAFRFFWGRPRPSTVYLSTRCNKSYLHIGVVWAHNSRVPSLPEVGTQLQYFMLWELRANKSGIRSVIALTSQNHKSLTLNLWFCYGSVIINQLIQIIFSNSYKQIFKG